MTASKEQINTAFRNNTHTYDCFFFFFETTHITVRKQEETLRNKRM
jgi:hypothetical protein